ncbi:tetratricopeptide repeat protein [Niveibacterium terrae]|uniref:tetratricopeptide repeat protein n=1 Tax=Niveibacterium terrae TaxID=3373598 RepID=UPI003A95DEEB
MISRPFVSLARSCLLALICVSGVPAWAEAGIAEVQTLLRQANYPAALTRVNALLAKTPNDAQARFAKGVILTELKRNNEAIAVYLALAKDRPDLPEPYNNLAVIYAQQKQYDKAKAALEQAIRTHPAYATAHENLGDVYAKLASQAYDKALQIDSANTHAQTKLAQIRDLMSAPTPRPGQLQPKAPTLATAPAKPAPVPTPPAKPVAVPTPVKPVQVAKVETKPAPKPVLLAKAEPKAPVKPEPRTDAKSAAKETNADAKDARLAARAAAKDANEEAQVQKLVKSWASSWSRKDVHGYLSHYASDFKTPNAMARKAWEAERESRLTKPGKISVEVEKLKVKIDGDEATVRFRQSYDSANLKSSSGKTLVLKRIKGRWQIQQERIGG